MNNCIGQRLRRRALAFALLAPLMTLAPPVLAQSMRTAPLPGAPPAGQGKTAGTAPQGAPAPGMPPTGVSPAAVHPLPVAGAAVPAKKTPQGEQFFIVASVDLQKSQLLLKYPTEVTLLMHVNDATKFVDEAGKPIKLSDFRAGDTVWVASANNQGEVTALRVRKGIMTVADLHRYYLDYAEIK
jgi:hypothetical protein